jgi:acyl dehydratase
MARRVQHVDELAELVGQELAPSEWVEVTQDRVDRFADVVDDRHWAHNDPEVAAAGPFGGTIGHAHLTLSLAPSLFSQVLRIDDGGSTMFYGYDRVRFPSAVPVGTRIRMHARIEEVGEVAGGVQLRVGQTTEIDGVERPACVAVGLWRHYAVAAPGS